MKKKQIILFATVLFFAACSETKTETAQQSGQQAQSAETQQKSTETATNSQITLEAANQYVPKGFKIVAFDKEANLLGGDFNGDKIEDFAIMVASDNVENYHDAADVRIIICEGNGSTFVEKTRSGNLGGFFIHDSETKQLSFENNNIVFTYQGMRYDYSLRYRFEKKDNDYMLIGREDNSYGNAVNDGSGNISTNYLTGIRLENLNKWDEKKEVLIELPEKKIKVSKTLIPLSALNENNVSSL